MCYSRVFSCFLVFSRRGKVIKGVSNKFNSITLGLLLSSTFSCVNQIEVSGSKISIGGISSVCPTGYILIPGNATLAVDDFCIMKYEAKAWQDDNLDSIISDTELDETDWIAGWTRIDSLTATHKPVSTLDRRPWDLSANEAWSVCDELNSETIRGDIDNDTSGDGTYALTSNPEWMTIARNIENVAANWTSGIVGAECIKQGNNGNTKICASGQASFNGPDVGVVVGPSGVQSSVNSIASHTLSNGEVIWDFSGGVEEWVDWERTNAYIGILAGNMASDGGSIAGTRELNSLDTNVGPVDKMFFDSWSPANTALVGIDGIGNFRSSSLVTAHLAAQRGGKWNMVLGTTGGVYDLKFFSPPTLFSSFSFSIGCGCLLATPLSVGFRCVFRP